MSFKRVKPNPAALLAIGTIGTIGGATLLSVSAACAQVVEITGTRIRSLDAVSNSPVSTVSAGDLNATQPVAVEEVIKNLPSAAPSMGPGMNNGSSGGARIDLRGLGAGSTSSPRTLVLMNGRRLVPFDRFGYVDTNTIPLALLDRVELVTGGASAVYGADAVAGVVNFITKRSFSGVELSGVYGMSGEGDAKRWRTDLAMGSSLADGRGSVMLGIGRTTTDPLTQGERPIGKVTLSSTTGAPSGSSTDVPAQFLGLPGGLGSPQLDTTTGRLVTAGPGFNFAPQNYYVTPMDRTQFSAFGNLVLSEGAEVYGELLYTRSDVVLNSASSGTFFNNYNVPIGNPFIPSAARQQLCTAFNIAAADCVVGNRQTVPLAIGRRFVEFGPRVTDFQNKSSRYTVGVKGALMSNLGGNWGYDAYYASSQADQTRTSLNAASLSKARQALNAVSTTSCIDASNGCVPLNVFGAAGSITPAMLGFISLNAIFNTAVTQEVLAASATGEVTAAKSPWAKSGLNMALGVESRRESLATRADAASGIQGEVLGSGAPVPDRKGSVALKEAFLEAQLPLMQARPGVHSLALEAGYRWTEFAVGGAGSRGYDTSKLGGEYAPIKGLRLRAMQQRATRSPTINELFAPQTSGLSNLATDPCQGNRTNSADANRSGTLSNLCRETGVPSNQIGLLPAPSAGQINNLGGGNADLGPEEAKTTTLGIVFSPQALPGLTLSFDYYKIDIDKAISNASTTDILNGCYDATLNPGFAFNQFCALIFRSPLNGTFNGAESRGVFTASSNLGRYRAAGYDIAVDFRLPLRDLGLAPKWGVLDLGIKVNKVEKLEFQATPTALNRNCNGYYSIACGNNLGEPNFKHKINQRTSWTVGDLRVGYNWRHLSAVIEEPGGASFLESFSRIKSYDYVDLDASWSVSKNLRLSLSIANLFDKKPPVVGNTIGTTSGNSGNTFPQVYDVVGRYFTVGATMKF
jgi:iron complex outermembrane recepter protein